MSTIYSIGEMSKICNIPIQTLRYYDKIDLLKPQIKNKENNYRYYTNKQILIIKIIQYLKGLDFSLEEIKELIKRDNLSLFVKLFINKKIEIEHKINDLQGIYKQLDEHLINVERTLLVEDAPYLELKTLDKRTIAFTRYHSACNPQGFSFRINELINQVNDNNLDQQGYIMVMYYDPPENFNYDYADIEVATPVRHNHESLTREIPSGQYITAIHKGPYSECYKGYQAMKEWCKEHGYEIVGPATEIYIIDIAFTKNPEEFVTELQFQVKK